MGNLSGMSAQHQSPIDSGRAQGWTWTRFLDSFVFFTWWVRLSAKVQSMSTGSRWLLLAIAMAFGCAARLWAQTKPGNYDFHLWWLIGEAALNGQDPYALHRYNYPPLWLGIVTAFHWLTSDVITFRLLLSLLLCAVDIGIALILARKGYLLAAIVFLLSPITIAISGQHQQVDGVATLAAFLAMALAGKSARGRLSGLDWGAAVLLGISLGFKPVYLILPIWFLFRPGPWSRRLVYALVPYAIFGAALVVAFQLSSPSVVLHYVLGHGGANNSPMLWNLLPDQVVPGLLAHGFGKIAFIIPLIAVGWLFRKLPPLEMALAYSVSALLFSWAVANQYLAIPMAAVAVFLNIGFLAWLGLGSIYLGGATDVLNLPILRVIQPNLLLEYDIVFRDMWPWLLIGWVLMIVGLRDPRRHWNPQGVSSAGQSSIGVAR